MTDYSTVGAGLISLSADVTAWLAGNFIGSMYMFMILMIFFSVIITLGGKNR